MVEADAVGSRKELAWYCGVEAICAMNSSAERGVWRCGGASEEGSGDWRVDGSKAGPLGMTGRGDRIWGVVQRDDCSDAGVGWGEVKVSSKLSLGLRPPNLRTAGGPPDETRRSCLGP